MRLMVIERFRDGDPKPIGERFRRAGRMLPDGVTYEASWIDPAGMRCFQLMQAPHRNDLDAWLARWEDLVDFEVVEVVDSAGFWGAVNGASSSEAAAADLAAPIPAPAVPEPKRELHVRAVRESDAEAIARIYAPIVESTPDSFEEVAPDAAEIRRRIASTTAAYPWYVAALDDEVAAYAYASAHRARPAYRTSVDVSAYVDPKAQRRGIATLLYGALFRELAERGYHRAFAGIVTTNEPSIEFHRRAGFTPVGVYHEVGFKLGRWHDTSWWERDLAAPAPSAE